MGKPAPAPSGTVPGKRSRSTNPPADPAAKKLLANNRFAVLENGAEPVKEKIDKMPPIHVKGFPEGLRESIVQYIGKGLKCTIRFCAEGYKLMAPSRNHYNAVRAILKQKGCEYYSHDIEADKPFKAVLRGLPDMEVEVLSEELKQNGLKPVQIHKMRRHDTSRVYRDQLYLVHLEKHSTTLKDLQAIRVLSHIVVKWDRYKPVQRDVTQCMKCLKFGHGAKNCYMVQRCHHCGKSHEKETCDLIEAADPVCANCGGDHKATSKTCPKRAEYTAIRKRASVNNQPGRKQKKDPPAVTPENYPLLVPQQNQQQGGNNTPTPGPSKSSGQQQSFPPGFWGSRPTNTPSPDGLSQLEVADFLLQHKIDIAFLTETHLKPEVNFYLPDHAVVRLDRPRQGGGVAIAIRRETEYRMLPDFCLSLIEAVGVQLATPEGPITVAAIYCPVQCKNSDGTPALLKKDIQNLTRRQGKFIFVGDLNARHSLWGSQRGNKNGAILADDLQAGHFVVLHPDSPTFYSAAGVGSTLDIVLTNVAEDCSPLRSLTELSSDHLPVVFEVNQDTIQRQQHRRRNYHRANWPQLQRHVEEWVPENPVLETEEDIDIVLQALSNVISEAEQRFIPTTPVTCKFTNLDPETKSIISLRNCVRRQFQRTQNPSRKVLYKKLNKIIAARVEKIRNRQFAKDIKNLPNYSKPFWRLTKVLKSKPKPIPPLRSDNVVHVSPVEKANAISSHFMASHNLGRDIVSPMEAEVFESVFQLAAEPIELPEDNKITVDELACAIRRTKNMKAPGLDGLFNIVLKNLGPKAHALLANTFNRCLELGYFPNAWKNSKVIPILKPGKDPSNPSSYRPISLLSSLSKLFESLVYTRLLEHTEANEILLEEQFGFRRGHSTVDQLKRVTNSISNAKAISKTTVMALLDIEKAFDNVWHDGLIHKLHRFRFPCYLVRTISSYLEGRTSQVSIGSALSEPYEVPAGVPQGSILGPILYNLFTSDIPHLPHGGALSLFADDSAISYQGRVMRHLINKLQGGLDAYTKYLTDWKICVNAAKTQTIVFPHRNSERLKPTSSITIHGAEIEWSNEVRYLGLVLDSKLLFRQHVEDRIKKGTVMLKRLYPIINRQSKASTVNKLAIYRQVVAPMLEYGSPVWQGCARSHRKKLQILQNKFLKMILQLPTRTPSADVHRLANLDPIDTRLALLGSRHQTRARNSVHDKIRNLYP